MSRVLVTVLVLAASLTVGAFPAGAQPRAEAQPAAPQKLQQLGTFADFNNDGRTDLAVGAPGENFGATADAGAITIFLGTGSGTGLPSASQTLVQDNPETGDQFGAALAVGDFNDDGFGDLAVGAPGENVGATVDAGAVNVLFGSPAGLTTSQTLLQDNPETGDQFGAALAVGDFNDVGEVDLVVGAPGEDVGATADAGAANLFASTGGVLPGVSGGALLQDNPEAGDRFGAAFAIERFDIGSLDLVVGAPGEDVGGIADAGAANLFANSTGVLPSVSSQTLLQDNPEAGDQFGATLTVGRFAGGNVDLVVGAPGENVGATADAGAANRFANTGGGLPSVSSQTLLQDNPEAGDQFGAALALGDFNIDPIDDLVVGAPGEDVGATADAGAANTFLNTGGGLPSVSGPALLQDNPEAGDQFGAALTVKILIDGGFFLFGDLVVGAPGENVGGIVDAGAANLFSNTAGALPSVSSQTLLQATETGDQFGAALDG
jgi:hypothetical protein